MLTDYCGDSIVDRSSSVHVDDFAELLERSDSINTAHARQRHQHRNLSMMAGDQEQLVCCSLQELDNCDRQEKIVHSNKEVAGCVRTPVRRGNPKPPKGQPRFLWAPRRRMCVSHIFDVARDSEIERTLSEVRRKLNFENL
ncbi:hypothetical protein Tcan_15296 [Toxocara canis]|uniref:Uncharacterized protein n=1 Tax=Toxocara canis TaxID=6265 RepID=A0A0B2VRH2_TOXCA|nr:hypothetical protein Tcan_15296 [Toxocara canis]